MLYEVITVLHMGQKSGTWKYYSPEGKIMAETDYYKDVLHGLNKVYFPDGKVKEEYNYWGNERHGAFVENYKDGT